MAPHRLPTLIAAALLLATPIVAQAPQTPGPPALEGSYNGGSGELLLSWTPAAGTPEGSEYTVFQNGVAVAHTTELHLAVDLSGWPQGLRVYEVNATWPGGGSGPSQAFRLAKDIELPPNCPVASVSIYTQPPGVQYEVYEDCIPG